MDLKKILFKYRGFTPIPLVLIVLIYAKPTFTSFSWGFIIMLLGEMIRIWAVSYAGGATRTRNVGAHQLVTNGPFARVRNPLYLGNMLMYCGAAVIANIWLPWLVLVVLIYFGFQYHLIVKLEEEKLSQLFGDEYAAYKSNVPRFLPKLLPVAGKNPVYPRFGKAIISEKSTFISFFIILVLMAGKIFWDG